MDIPRSYTPLKGPNPNLVTPVIYLLLGRSDKTQRTHGLEKEIHEFI